MKQRLPFDNFKTVTAAGTRLKLLADRKRRFANKALNKASWDSQLLVRQAIKSWFCPLKVRSGDEDSSTSCRWRRLLTTPPAGHAAASSRRFPRLAKKPTFWCDVMSEWQNVNVSSRLWSVRLTRRLVHVCECVCERERESYNIHINIVYGGIWWHYKGSNWTYNKNNPQNKKEGKVPEPESCGEMCFNREYFSYINSKNVLSFLMLLHLLLHLVVIVRCCMGSSGVHLLSTRPGNSWCLQTCHRR